MGEKVEKVATEVMLSEAIHFTAMAGMQKEALEAMEEMVVIAHGVLKLDTAAMAGLVEMLLEVPEVLENWELVNIFNFGPVMR